MQYSGHPEPHRSDVIVARIVAQTYPYDGAKRPIPQIRDRKCTDFLITSQLAIRGLGDICSRKTAVGTWAAPSRSWH